METRLDLLAVSNSSFAWLFCDVNGRNISIHLNTVYSKIMNVSLQF